MTDPAKPMSDDKLSEIRGDLAFDERRVSQLDDDAAAWFFHAKALLAEVERARADAEVSASALEHVVACFTTRGQIHDMPAGQRGAIDQCRMALARVKP